MSAYTRYRLKDRSGMGLDFLWNSGRYINVRQLLTSIKKNNLQAKTKESKRANKKKKKIDKNK
jgi:hypothetical protein